MRDDTHRTSAAAYVVLPLVSTLALASATPATQALADEPAVISGLCSEEPPAPEPFADQGLIAEASEPEAPCAPAVGEIPVDQTPMPEPVTETADAPLDNVDVCETDATGCQPGECIGIDLPQPDPAADSPACAPEAPGEDFACEPSPEPVPDVQESALPADPLEPQAAGSDDVAAEYIEGALSAEGADPAPRDGEAELGASDSLEPAENACTENDVEPGPAMMGQSPAEGLPPNGDETPEEALLDGTFLDEPQADDEEAQPDASKDPADDAPSDENAVEALASTTKDGTADDESDKAAACEMSAAEDAAAAPDAVSQGQVDAQADAAPVDLGHNMYRLYNPYSGEHLYTGDLSEAKGLASHGWRWEGVGWVTPESGESVFRLYNPYTGDHHYTVSAKERDALKKAGWRYEGVAWYSAQDGVAVLREFNPYATTGTHNYTTSAREDVTLGQAGWKREGVAFNALSSLPLEIDGFWLVSDSWGSKERYWVDSTGSIATHRLVSPDEGSGYWAYATTSGAVVRGRQDIEGRIYLAADNGKLENPGWVDSSAYGQGSQRYWIDASTHAAVPGYFTTAAGEIGYTTQDGYVLRGSATIDGAKVTADSRGVIAHAVSALVAASDGTVQRIASTFARGAGLLLLPSHADLSSLALVGFDGSSPVLLSSSPKGAFSTYGPGNAVDLTKVAAKDSDGSYTLAYKTTAKEAVHSLRVMVSENIGSVFLTSADASGKGRGYVEQSPDHSAKAAVDVCVVDADGTTVYDDATSASKIKGRGNSTWVYGDKKPYQLTLGKKADLLATGEKSNKAKKWLLLANAGDATLLHNELAYDLGLELGLTGTENTPVDLYYDGEYRGTYLLCEKIEVGQGHVDIADLEEAIDDANQGADLEGMPLAVSKNSYGYLYRYVAGAQDPEDITGGYLLELDNAYGTGEACFFETSRGIFVLKSPELCSQNCMRYISEYVQSALNRFDAGETSDEDGAVLDLDSLARAYLANEFFKNIDAFNTSTYFYKDAGASAIVCAPLWDFDTSTGTRKESHDSTFMSYTGFTIPGNYWLKDNAVLQEQAREVWTQEFSPLIRTVVLGDAQAQGDEGHLRSLAYYRSLIASSQAMNEAVFGITTFNNCIAPFKTYEANYTYMRDWLTWRVNWFDDNISRLSGTVTNPVTVYRGVDYGLVYDYGYYLAKNPEVQSACGTNPAKVLEHFVTKGMAKALMASQNFDVKKYQARYKDLRQAFGSDLSAYYRHYLKSGFFEGRRGI